MKRYVAMRWAACRLGLWAAWLGLAAGALQAADWEQFRGPLGRGISSETIAPLTWDRETNIKWRTPLPDRGNSSPIVSRGKVFIAQADKDGAKRSLLCFDRQTGELLWSRTVEFSGRELTHQTNPYGSSTPVADGQRVVVWHSSAGMYCYDYDGNELWNRDLGPFLHIWGYAASPIIHGDLVINNCGPGNRTFLVALNKHNGEIVWQADEQGGSSGEEGNRGWAGSWSTPMLARVDGRDQVVVSFPNHVKAYDPANGKVIWQVDGLSRLVYTSVVVNDQYGVAMSGYGGPAMGFKLGGQGNVTETNRLWLHSQRQPQRIGSGILQDKYLFMVNEPGTAQCIDVTTGESTWGPERLPEGGRAWSSPVRVGDRLYVTTQSGTTIVFAANTEKFEQLAVNRLRETTNATIAVSDGEIFLRTFEALYCIAEKGEKGE